MGFTRLTALAFCAAALAACGGSDGSKSSMNPGQDCVTCHAFTVAGTVYPNVSASATQGVAGATVTITESGGASFVLATDALGNFWTSQPVALPITVTVQSGAATTAMAGSISATSSGRVGCNWCHGAGTRIH